MPDICTTSDDAAGTTEGAGHLFNGGAQLHYRDVGVLLSGSRDEELSTDASAAGMKTGMWPRSSYVLNRSLTVPQSAGAAASQLCCRARRRT